MKYFYHVRGVIVAILLFFNVMLCGVFVLIGAPFLLIPIKKLRHAVHWFMQTFMYSIWTDGNKFLLKLANPNCVWDIQGEGKLATDDWYLLIGNHQSWLDILILEAYFNHKIPVVKFFMKRELLWMLPMAGIACWLMGFPFMYRYTKEYLKKHPEKKGKDAQATRKACEHFRHTPIATMNFAEGTRFTKAKHARQASPFKHLLKPRAGGIAFVLHAMQGIMHNFIDVTIIYPEPNAGIWAFVCGRMKKIIVRYQVIPITPEMQGDYENDKAFRIQFQAWLNDLWQQKDAKISAFLAAENSHET